MRYMTGNSRGNALIDRVPSPLWHIINLLSNQIVLCSISIEPCVSITHSVWTICWLLNWSVQASHTIYPGLFLCLCKTWPCDQGQRSNTKHADLTGRATRWILCLFNLGASPPKMSFTMPKSCCITFCTLNNNKKSVYDFIYLPSEQRSGAKTRPVASVHLQREWNWLKLQDWSESWKRILMMQLKVLRGKIWLTCFYSWLLIPG